MEIAPSNGPVVYGRYQLLELIARGGMAEVFKAKSHGVEGFEKVVVIKRILPELGENPAFVEMFINEAKIAVTLSHANIVQVFDLGRAEDAYFIAMEYVAGTDLATLLRRGRRVGKPLPQELAVYVVSELAKGLDYAHRRKDAGMRPLYIVHRDVSPQNALLSWEGEVKLTDFGIAKARTTVENETEAGVLKGKYAYMAPEQAHGGDVDGRTDIFALGTVLYEALSGQNPFITASTYETLKRVREGKAQPIHEVAQVPDELAAIVTKAMAPQPGDRHAHASRLYEDLLQFLFASGRRVGAHDLAEYLAEVRQASETDSQPPRDDASLRAAFDDADASSRAPTATPVEVPSGRSGMRPRGAPTQTSTGAARVPSVSVSRPVAERRDVTALAVGHDAGEPAARATLERLVSRYGGELVDDVGGTPVGPAGGIAVAIFGAREPDGRDTDAAARCALRLARTSTTPLRIAVHAGRILVDLDGVPVREDRFHDLVQTARRLAGAGEAGRVRVTATTAKLLRVRFELSPAGADGACVLSGERSFAEAYGKFVGRREDLRRIGESLALANKGHLRIVSVVGEPGSGKSRLLHETLRRLKIGGHDVGAYLAVCAPQDRTTPLSAVAEMLRTVFGVDELDGENVVRDKVGRSRELGLTPVEQDAVGALLGLSSRGDAPPQGEHPLRSAMLKVATRLAVDRLTVFAWDSAESMDEESQGFLDSLLRRAGESRVAVVIAYRPGFAHGWADLPGYEEVTVSPLADDDVARLTGSRLGADEVPYDLLRDVTLKSGGNPLYVEEYLRALVDSQAVEVVQGKVVYKRDIAELEVPKSLRGIVASRIARLGGMQRHILQIAGVVGARFTPEVLARVAGENLSAVATALSALERRGIVLHHGAGEYGFANDLMPEVLLDGLPVEAKRELHAAVADALEVLHDGRTDEIAERLAHHRREGGDRESAVGWLERAATRLEDDDATGSAMAQLVAAVALLRQAPTPDHERILALYRRIGELAFASRKLEDGAHHMSAALEIAEPLLRDAYVARFSMMRGRLLANANRFEEGRRWLERGRDVAARLGDRTLHRDALLGMSEAAAKNGEYVRAAAALREALTISRELGDVKAQIRCLIPLALALGSAGERENGLAALDEAKRLAGDTPDRYTEVEIPKMRGLVCYFTRDYRGTVESAQRALDLAKEYGFDYEVAVNAHNLGEAHLHLGDFKRAFASLRYSYEVAREHGYVRLQMINLRVLGYIDATRFGSAEGRERVAQAIDHAAQQGYVWDIIEGKFLLALIDHGRGATDEARRLLAEVLRLAADNGHRRYVEDAESALAAIDRGEAPQLPS